MVLEPKGERFPDHRPVALAKTHFRQNPERLLEGSNLAAFYSFLDPGDKFVEHVLYWGFGNESQEVTGLRHVRYPFLDVMLIRGLMFN
jgi:hypothetical protein